MIVHRAPRLNAPAPAAEVTFPAEAASRVPTRVPLIAAFTPLVAGVVLSLVLHQWQFLAFTALSPLMVLGQAAGDRLSSRQDDRRARVSARLRFLSAVIQGQSVPGQTGVRW